MIEQHTKTPWTISVYGNVEMNHDTIRVSGFALSGGNEAKANARRIVACVNACDGFSSDVLENVTLMGDTILSRFENQRETFSKIEQQRDELLAALIQAKALIESAVPFEGDVMRQIKAAIAKAEQ